MYAATAKTKQQYSKQPTVADSNLFIHFFFFTPSYPPTQIHQSRLNCGIALRHTHKPSPRPPRSQMAEYMGHATVSSSHAQHWWFSGKIGRCHWTLSTLPQDSDRFGQPRVRFPADARHARKSFLFCFCTAFRPGCVGGVLSDASRRCAKTLPTGGFHPPVQRACR